MNSVNFIIKTYNENIIKSFINLNFGPIFLEESMVPESLNKKKLLYIIDDNYPMNIESLKEKYFLLTDISNNKFPISEFFQGYFLKPLDINIMKKQLEIWVHTHSHKTINTQIINQFFAIKQYFVNQITYHSNSLNTYYHLILTNHGEDQGTLVKIHTYSLQLIKIFLLIYDGDFDSCFHEKLLKNIWDLFCENIMMVGTNNLDLDTLMENNNELSENYKTINNGEKNIKSMYSVDIIWNYNHKICFIGALILIYILINNKNLYHNKFIQYLYHNEQEICFLSDLPSSIFIHDAFNIIYLNKNQYLLQF